MPSARRSAALRMLTGTIARTPAAGSGSPRCSNRRRRPPAVAASTTSLTVPPRERLITFRSSSGHLDHGQRASRADRLVEARCRGGDQLITDEHLDQGAGATQRLAARGRGESTTSTPAPSDVRGRARGTGPEADDAAAPASTGTCASCRPSDRGRGVAGRLAGVRAVVGRTARGVWLRVEDGLADVDRADAVDHAVMGLAHHRPAPIGELEHHDLPERAGAVEALGEVLARPLAKLRLSRRGREAQQRAHDGRCQSARRPPTEASGARRCGARRDVGGIAAGCRGGRRGRRAGGRRPADAPPGAGSNSITAPMCMWALWSASSSSRKVASSAVSSSLMRVHRPRRPSSPLLAAGSSWASHTRLRC